MILIICVSTRCWKCKNVLSFSRPIVAKFERYTDRETIRKESFELNREDNGYAVREQFPYEIEQRRKQLYPVMKHYKKNKNNKVVLVRDKLYINGKRYIPESWGVTQTPYTSRPTTQEQNVHRPATTNYHVQSHDVNKQASHGHYEDIPTTQRQYENTPTTQGQYGNGPTSHSKKHQIKTIGCKNEKHALR